MRTRSRFQSISLRGSETRCPYLIVNRFLGAKVVEQLLTYVCEHWAAFVPASVYRRDARKDSVIVDSRNCLRLTGIGPFESLMKDAVGELLPRAITDLGILERRIGASEFEFCAYRNGGFFAPHIDTLPTGRRRVLFCVYYFFREPVPFTGGELCLHAWQRLTSGTDAPSPIVEVRPRCDSLVIFPSLLRHEVKPVVGSSGEWRDSRFTINCWAYRSTAS